MSSKTDLFTRENLNMYLNEVAKTYRKLAGKEAKAEIVLVGGASILANYNFREGTRDIDAIIHSASQIKEAINIVGDKYNLPNGWLNADFLHTSSYTHKLDEFSSYYRTFSNILSVRTIKAEYLIAMKIQSGRSYKHDKSDIVGILIEHENNGIPITLEQIQIAFNNLYGNWTSIDEEKKKFIEELLLEKKYMQEQEYTNIRKEEFNLKENLIEFEKNNPGVANTDNINRIIKELKMKSNH